MAQCGTVQTQDAGGAAQRRSVAENHHQEPKYHTSWVLLTARHVLIGQVGD
jgi:hypothetical protein